MGDDSPSRLVPPATSRSACPICGHGNPDDARFCNACGAPLYLVPCSRCGAMNDRASAQCHECGTPLTHRSAGQATPPGARGAVASVPLPPAADLARSLAGPVADPQEALRELRRLMTTPVAEREGTARRPSVTPEGSSAPEPEAASLAGASAPLPDAGTDVAPTHRKAPDTSTRRRPSVWIAAATVIVLAAAAAFYASRPQTTPAGAGAPSTAGEAKEPSSPAGGSPPVNLDGAASRAAPVASPPDERAPPTPGAEIGRPAPPEAPRAAATGSKALPQPAENGKEPQRDTANQALPPPAPASRAPETPRAATRTAPRPTTTSPTEAVLLPPTPVPGGGSGKIEPPPPRIGPCTEALAALGLCNQEPAQRRE